MEKHRTMSTYFWGDTWIEELNAHEKLVYCYLCFNRSDNLAGIYQIEQSVISGHTGIPLTEIKDILEKFTKDEKIIFKDNIVAIKNRIKNNNLNNKYIVKSIIEVLKNSPEWAVEFVNKEGLPEDSLRTPQGVIDNSNKNKNKSKDKSKDKSKNESTKDLSIYILKWNNSNWRTIIKDIKGKRKHQLETRLSEKKFDFDKILEMADKSGDFLKTSNWFSFDWIIKNDTNWRKLIEGNYIDKKSEQHFDHPSAEQLLKEMRGGK